MAITMNLGQSLFAQLMDHLPIHEFRKCVQLYGGNYRVRSFSCWGQFLCMAFAQLALEPPCLPGRRYGVLQESSAPRADEEAIWDTFQSRKPGSLRAMARQFETACAI